MALTKQDLQAISQVVRHEVSAQHVAYHEWLAGARAKIDEGMDSLANGQRASGPRVFANIREKQAKRRAQRTGA